jgi:hypothetical protein
MTRRPFREQKAHEVAADEPGSTGDEDSVHAVHGCWLLAVAWRAPVIPAQAGTHEWKQTARSWIPACAGLTYSVANSQ